MKKKTLKKHIKKLEERVGNVELQISFHDGYSTKSLHKRCSKLERAVSDQKALIERRSLSQVQDLGRVVKTIPCLHLPLTATTYESLQVVVPSKRAKEWYENCAVKKACEQSHSEQS